jgi:hypothetical protein
LGRTLTRADGFPTFRLIFTAVVSLTVLSLVAAIVLSWVAENDAQKQLVEACSTCWKMGFGAVVGMIGGKPG